MALVFSPSEHEIDEFVQFSLTVTVTEDIVEEPVPEVKILAATSTSTGITVSYTDTTFTVSGKYTDAFARTITFLDKNLVSVTVEAFDDIPTGFSSIINYVAPSVLTVDEFITVTFENHGPVDYLIVVNNNWPLANAALTEKVPEGKF